MAKHPSAERLALYLAREESRRKRTRARRMATIRKGYETGRLNGFAKAGTR